MYISAVWYFKHCFIHCLLNIHFDIWCHLDSVKHAPCKHSSHFSVVLSPSWVCQKHPSSWTEMSSSQAFHKKLDIHASLPFIWCNRLLLRDSLDIALPCKSTPPSLEVFVRRRCNRELSGQSHHTWWLRCNNNSSTAHLTSEHPHLLPSTEQPSPCPGIHKSHTVYEQLENRQIIVLVDEKNKLINAMQMHFNCSSLKEIYTPTIQISKAF